MTESKYCPRCEQNVPLSGWICNKARSDGLSGHCRTCHNAINDEIRRRRRSELLEKLGNKCVRCGFSDPRALQIDHVNGGGRAQARVLNTNTNAFRKLVLENPDEYQLLCANCNVIKRIENQEHRDKSTYVHNVPTADRPRTPKPTKAETNARRSSSLKQFWEDADDKRQEISERTRRYNEGLTEEQKAEISAKIAAARAGTKKGPDGKWYKPQPLSS